MTTVDSESPILLSTTVGESTNDEFMDVDNNKMSDLEDGELSEPTNPILINRVYDNHVGGFNTGIDIFSPELQEKLGERAKRFNLDPTNNASVSDYQIQQLYQSLGIENAEDQNIRFDTVHIRGTENMSTENVFDYFNHYGPATIEWINDYSCNVVWHDTSSSTRALIGMSTRIEGLDKLRKQPDYDSKLLEADDSKIKPETTIVVSSLEGENGDVVMVEEEIEVPKTVVKDVVHASTIDIPIPPGMWRMGRSHSQAKCILLRFATKADKKALGAEKMSMYYKKYGNPNFGGIKGLISHSKRSSVFSKNSFDETTQDTKDDKKNPWGNLSQTWDDTEDKPRNYVPLRKTAENSSILNRIGMKRELVTVSNNSDSDSSDEWRKRLKVPRRKMYADEEEIRIEKSRLEKHKLNGNNFNVTLNLQSNYESEEEENENRILQRVPIKKAKSDIKARLGSIQNKPVEVKTNVKDRLSHKRRLSNTSLDSNDDTNTLRSSYLSVVSKVRRPSPMRPVVQSAVSRHEGERRRNNTSESSYESSDDEYPKQTDLRQTIRTKSTVHRPGFDKADLRSRLSNKSMNRDNSLRIEIDNNYYSDES